MSTVTLFWLAVVAASLAGALLYGLSWRRVAQALLDSSAADAHAERCTDEATQGSGPG